MELTTDTRANGFLERWLLAHDLPRGAEEFHPQRLPFGSMTILRKRPSGEGLGRTLTGTPPTYAQSQPTPQVLTLLPRRRGYNNR